MKRKTLKIRKWMALGVALGALALAGTAQARPVTDGPDFGPAVASAPAKPVSTTGAGFDWTDAAIGAVVAFGAVAGAAGLAQVARNRRRLATLH